MNTFPNFPTAKAILLGTVLLFAQSQPIWAQTPSYGNQPTAQYAQNNPSLLSSLAPYRDDVRHTALVASQQPNVLDKLAQQQMHSQDAFNNLIGSYGQTKQGWFYDLARYPDIQHTLATLPGGTDRTAVDAITKPMPAALQESAWKLYRHHHDDLVQVDNLNQQANNNFEGLISPLDEPTQEAFRQLITTPDVLSLLTQQLDKTTQLGQDYQADATGVTQKLTAMHDSIDVQTKQQLAEYQQQLDQDPQAKQELQQAGREYAQQNGINRPVGPPNPSWPANNSYYYQNPYSFWFGYPYWYGSPMWYPGGFAYGAGYGYGLGGSMFLFGWPSYGFSNWFFTRGYYNYPHLYNRFNSYYNTYGARGFGYVSPGNRGFIGAARQAFGPVNGGYSNYGSRGSGTGIANGNGRMSAPMGRTQNMSASPSRSWGGSFGSSRGTFGGGGFSGSRGFGGGGSRGGGGRR